MVSIEKYTVIEPPTSGGLTELAFQQLSRGGLLKLVLLGHAEVPRSTRQEVEFRIAQTLHPEEGGLSIGGTTAENAFVLVHASSDSAEPATASVTR